MRNPFSQFKKFVAGNALHNAHDAFEIASINLLMNYVIIGLVLASLFSILLYLQGFQFVASINGITLLFLLVVFAVLKRTSDVKKATTVYIIIQQLSSIAWGFVGNFSTEPDQLLWLLLNILIAFFILGNTWGFIIAAIDFVYVAFGLIDRLSGYKHMHNHFAAMPQVNLVAVAVPFLLDIFIVREFVRTRTIAERQIKEANAKNEELLLNILPSETAEELKATGTAEAKSFDEVTVMFTDFKNFTQASEKMNAKELVSEINYIFSGFDKIISKHNIEKIKTIGDSYMCAGGLPVANKTNAVDVVSAALGIQHFMNQLKDEREKENKRSFEIRIGIHTGPVVAGIVGVKKFAYDIWGDTVNIASRMESSGEVGKVNISGATYELVKEKFQCTYRGKIPAKNKGEIDMYFVEASLEPPNMKTTDPHANAIAFSS